jgi:high-affinity iron transporter
MLAALVIVFREAMEAGLIVGIVMAATRDVAGRGRMIALGIAVGVAGACLIAAFAGQIGALFDGVGQEVFQASVLALAVLMLGWHTIWMASHGRQTAQEMKALGASVREGSRGLTALAVVIGVSVLREGSEIVLFMYGIMAGGDVSAGSMAIGGGLGIAAGAAMAWLMYRGLLAIPSHRLFTVTSWLIMLVAAGLASQAIGTIQRAGYAAVLDQPLWDTGWLLSESSLPGKLLHTLIGYTDQPDGLQLIVYALTLGLIFFLSRPAAPPPSRLKRPA